MQNLALLGSLPAGIRSTSRHSQHFVCPIPHHKCHRKATTRRHQGTPQGVRPESGPHSGLLWDLHTTRALDHWENTAHRRGQHPCCLHACKAARSYHHLQLTACCKLHRRIGGMGEGNWANGRGGGGVGSSRWGSEGREVSCCLARVCLLRGQCGHRGGGGGVKRCEQVWKVQFEADEDGAVRRTGVVFLFEPGC